MMDSKQDLALLKQDVKIRKSLRMFDPCKKGLL